MAKGKASAEERGFLAALKKDPKDVAARGAFADWLEEHARPYEAALQRAKAGLSEVYYKVRRKSDGLFSTGNNSYGEMGWSEAGKMWRRLTDVLGHLRGHGEDNSYGGTAWKQLEIVFCEVRVTYTATLPVTMTKERGVYRRTPSVAEPLGGETGEE
jgi:uncharacterized protein (TIGR02996 family)